jgi:hypothetical protein
MQVRPRSGSRWARAPEARYLGFEITNHPLQLRALFGKVLYLISPLNEIGQSFFQRARPT